MTVAAAVNWDEVAGLRRRRFAELSADERRGPLRMMFSSAWYNRYKSEMHLFGTTRQGDSVHLLVENFYHYFWVECPKEVEASSDEQLAQLLQLWNSEINATKKYPARGGGALHALSLHRRESIIGYKGVGGSADGGVTGAFRETRRPLYLKVEVKTPGELYDAAKFFAQYKVPLLNNLTCGALECFEERGIDYQARFMCDTGLVGYGWVEVSKMRIDRNASATTTTWDVICDVGDFKAFTPDDGEEYSYIAPQRIFDFDIECLSHRGFPTPEKCPVIQIAVQVTDTGSDGERTVLDVVLHTGESEPFPPPDDAVIMARYATESEMLLGFAWLVNVSDYDISRNYNGRMFDWPYLFDRADALGISEVFCSTGRLRNVKSELAKSTFQSAARGTRAYRDANIVGRVDFDICDITRREEKFGSYKLNAVAREVLGDTKEDVHHSMIAVLHEGTPADRLRLARYCRKDAALPRMICNKLMYLVRYAEQARVCRVTLEDLVRRGQQIKVLSQLMRLAQEFGYILPTKRNASGYEPEGQYDGAIVLEPDVGFHEEPIACLDFSSLYPSECIADNICYTTLVLPKDVSRYKEEDLFRAPSGHVFVRPHVHKGILCILEQRLLAQRKIAKGDVKTCYAEAKRLRAAGDEAGARREEHKASVQDARQVALKLSANSAYGFTGVKIQMGGLLPCCQVAETITSCGRRDLLGVVDWLKKHYPQASVKYGDTDSVMVAPGVKTVKEAMEWMHRIAGEINAEKFAHRAPMKLAPEKVMYPALFIAKKRYKCGYFETTHERPDKIYYRGVEEARRDGCVWRNKCLDACSRKIFLERDIESAVQIAKDAVQALYLNEVCLSQLMISKSLSQDPAAYVNPQPHTVLALKMAARDPGSAPVVGDRVPYIMVGSGTGKICELSEDPLYALENEIPPNVDYYLKNQLMEPLKRLFVPIIGAKRTSEIFNGEHTRKRVCASLETAARKAPKTSILSFAVVKRSCAECRSSYDPAKHDHPSLCAACLEKHGADKHAAKKRALVDIEDAYQTQFAKCQACQGSDRDPVLCMARDCEQLYKRKGLEFKRRRLRAEVGAMEVLSSGDRAKSENKNQR